MRFVRDIIGYVVAALIVNAVLVSWDTISTPVPSPRAPAYIASRPVVDTPPPTTFVVPKPTPEPAYVPASAPAQKIRLGGGSARRILWTNLYELESYNAAYKAHVSTYEIMKRSTTVGVPTGVLVLVLEERNEYLRLEVQEGEHIGYQGWLDWLPGYKPTKPPTLYCQVLPC